MYARPARLLACVVAALFLGSCRFQLQGPPLIVEMPEVGAQVDVSGWVLYPDPLGQLPKTDPGTRPASIRFAKSSGWAAEMQFQANPVAFPNITVRRRAPINESYKTPQTLEGCAKSESEKQRSGALSSWKLISPPVKTTIGGLDALDVTNEVTVAGLDTPIRTRWVFLVKGAYRYAIGAQAQKAFWDKQQYLMDPVFASIKPL